LQASSRCEHLSLSRFAFADSCFGLLGPPKTLYLLLLKKIDLDQIAFLIHSSLVDGVDGSRVEEMILAGKIEVVARYCESDVLNTYRVWLVYELFRGSITAKELDWSEAQIRDFVAIRRASNPHLCAVVGV
jgi:hypothetical protein